LSKVKKQAMLRATENYEEVLGNGGMKLTASEISCDEVIATYNHQTKRLSATGRWWRRAWRGKSYAELDWQQSIRTGTAIKSTKII